MKRLGFLLAAFLLLSCSQHNSSLNYANSDRLAYELIKTSVEETLKLDPGTSRPNYYLDLSRVKNLNRDGIAIFLRQTGSAHRISSTDSLLRHNKAWLTDRYLEKTLVAIDEIKQQKDGTLLVITSKTLAADGANGAEIVLQRQGNGYKCIGAKITWIS